MNYNASLCRSIVNGIDADWRSWHMKWLLAATMFKTQQWSVICGDAMRCWYWQLFIQINTLSHQGHRSPKNACTRFICTWQSESVSKVMYASSMCRHDGQWCRCGWWTYCGTMGKEQRVVQWHDLGHIRSWHVHWRVPCIAKACLDGSAEQPAVRNSVKCRISSGLWNAYMCKVLHLINGSKMKSCFVCCAILSNCIVRVTLGHFLR